MESDTAYVTSPSTISNFIGTRESPILIYGPHLENRSRTSRAQLRLFPVFFEFGIDSFIYDSLCEESFQLADHEFHAPTGTKGGCT